MTAREPAIGEWYRMREGGLLEVVALDEADGTVEVQYFDGTVEEIELEDWHARFGAGEIEEADAPEDWSGSVDVDRDDDGTSLERSEDSRHSAGTLDGLDLFE